MKIEYNEHNEIEMPISADLDRNIEVLEALFADWGDIVQKRFRLERQSQMVDVYILYIDGLTDNEMVERTITRPLLYEWRQSEAVTFEQLFHNQTEAVDLVEETQMMEAVSAVLKGDTAIFVDGSERAMVLSTKKFPTRSVSEPDKEAGLKGPKDSFNENFRTDTALLRRRIKDPKMKLKQGMIGQRSRTVYGLMYMEDLVYPSLMEKIQKKLESFEIDGIYDSGMLVHLLEEKWYSPFPQVQTTQRPDKAASAILEGRVVLVVDNSPEVIILPTTWNTFF